MRIDFRKEAITVKGKGLTLGEFAEGPGSVEVRIALGDDERAVNVRMARKGKAVRY